MPMTLPCRCWRQETARRRPGACGRMFATIARRAAWQRRRYGSPTRPIARANIPSDICARFGERCRPMPTPDSISSIKRMAASRKSPVGRTSGASSTTCRKHTHRLLPVRLWNESQPCTPLRKRSAVGHQTSGNRFACYGRGLCFSPYATGSKSR